MATNQTYLRVTELAALWGVNKETILRRIARGDIEAIDVAPKGSSVHRWRIPASEANRPGMVATVAKIRKKAKR
jgi:excisionase family DNA binding protein